MPGTPEWMFLCILALILFGPKKLPGIAKGFGKFIAELQKAKEEFRREILNIPSLPEIKQPQDRQIHQSHLHTNHSSKKDSDPQSLPPPSSLS